MNKNFTSCFTWCPTSIRGQVLLKTCFGLLFLAASLPGFSQISVSGNVKDENGTVLPGASVLEKGTSNGTTTDAEGNYRIGVSSNSAILVFSFIGYKTQEMAVGQQSTINLSRAASGVIIINNEACWN